MKTQVRFEELEPPPSTEWGKTYHMLTRDKPGSYDLISLHGFFPVFETREDAVMVTEALEEDIPESGVKVRGLAYRIAVAAELSFGKPTNLVKPHIVSEDRK